MLHWLCPTVCVTTGAQPLATSAMTHSQSTNGSGYVLQVVDETGKPISPSKLTAPQIRVELEARGLMVEGTRKEIYKRLQVRKLRLLPSGGLCWCFGDGGRAMTLDNA